ncbi:hypothetical protein GCM10008025_02860 [Ornithinibacillus halotolerans]|uniref:Uncharacterized protein n=1 Tax=Ornithinibacillus halotolerans TaxID=1274357 RepID=A0A916W374_9BACI|nr:hypothetical protein GCM10008025_02860 [Ornithinibacillus halotolerans]
MGWALLLIVGYTPILFRMHRKINILEEEISKLKKLSETSKI